MRLTSELVASVHRIVADNGPTPGFVPMTDGDYEALADVLLAGRVPDGPHWVFAYGSLLWKPAFAVAEERRAVAPGWHRTFRLLLSRWRGTPDHPGLMLVLDRGGQCKGMAQLLPEPNIRDALIALLHREVSSRMSTNRPRWIGVNVEGVRTRAIAFCADRNGPAYAGRQPIEAVADVLATAVGHLGSCAEYLQRTVDGLEQHGIRDRRLWQLQAMVAERIQALVAGVDQTGSVQP
jgi:cation transport protein ChaC